MTEKDVQKIIRNCEPGSLAYQILVPNVFLYEWESDMIGVSVEDMIVEFEIKCSRFDYLAEAKKLKKRQAFERLAEPEKLPNMFYYVFADDMDIDEEIPEYAGLIVIEKRSNNLQRYTKIVKRAPALHSSPIKPEQWKELAIKIYHKL
jgi:hypothetical protein